MKNDLNILNFNNNVKFILVNKLFNYYILFLTFYSVNYLLNNSFNYFKKIFIDYNFFSYFNISNSKKASLYHYIMFKKQNSLMKKKYNLYNSLHPVYYRKKLRKKITDFNINNINSTTSSSILKFINVLSGKKKYRKTILLNRMFFNYLNFNKFKTSKKLSKTIFLNSKLALIRILLKLEYSLFYVITNTNIVKSYSDLKKLLQMSFIFLNRKPVYKTNYNLQPGDVLEFSLNYKMFNYIQKFKDLSVKYTFKLRTKLWFKIKSYSRIKINYNENKLAHSLLKNNILFKNNIPSYLEIDYTTLTIIVLYSSYNYQMYNYSLKKLLVLYLFKLYNWK